MPEWISSIELKWMKCFEASVVFRHLCMCICVIQDRNSDKIKVMVIFKELKSVTVNVSVLINVSLCVWVCPAITIYCLHIISLPLKSSIWVIKYEFLSWKLYLWIGILGGEIEQTNLSNGSVRLLELALTLWLYFSQPRDSKAFQFRLLGQITHRAESGQSLLK